MPPQVSLRINKWGKRAEILMTSHCPNLGSSGGSDWRKQRFLVAQPIRGTIQTWIVTHNQCGFIWILRFLRHYFVGKKVMASQNGGCFSGLLFLAVTIIKLWWDWRQINYLVRWDKYIWGRISFSWEKIDLNTT